MLGHRLIQGLSLLECMIALGLMAGILLIGENMFFIQHKVVQIIEQDIRQLQYIQQARLRLAPWIARAGYLGFQSFASESPLTVHGTVPSSQLPHRVLTIHQAHGASWSPPLPSVLQGKVNQGSDVLIIESAGPWHAPVLAFSAETGIQFAPPATISAGWYILAQGDKADIVWANVQNKEGIVTLLPTAVLTPDEGYTVVSPWQIHAIYLQPGDQHPDLMLKSLLPLQDAVALLSGVHRIHYVQENQMLRVELDAPDQVTLWFGASNAIPSR